MHDSLRIGLVCRDRTFAAAVETRCRLDGDLSVVWDADRWPVAAAMCASRRPDVVVVDGEVEAGDGGVAGVPAGGAPVWFVLVVSALPSVELERYRSLGPYAVLLKQEPLSALMLCLKQLHDRLGAADRPDRAGGETRRLRVDSPLNTLTPRQVQILKCLARGDSVKEAAASLALTAKSVTNHKYRIMQKLGVNDRVKLARLAIREGLVEP